MDQAGRCLFAIWQPGGPLMARTEPHLTSHLDRPKMAHLK